MYHIPQQLAIENCAFSEKTMEFRPTSNELEFQNFGYFLQISVFWFAVFVQ